MQISENTDGDIYTDTRTWVVKRYFNDNLKTADIYGADKDELKNVINNCFKNISHSEQTLF